MDTVPKSGCTVCDATIHVVYTDDVPGWQQKHAKFIWP